VAQMDKDEAALADMIKAKELAEKALTRLTEEQPLGRTTRVLNPRRRILEVLTNVIDELNACEDEYSTMLKGAATERHLNS
jgi:hypothetical protein